MPVCHPIRAAEQSSTPSIGTVAYVDAGENSPGSVEACVLHHRSPMMGRGIKPVLVFSVCAFPPNLLSTHILMGTWGKAFSIQTPRWLCECDGASSQRRKIVTGPSVRTIALLSGRYGRTSVSLCRCPREHPHVLVLSPCIYLLASGHCTRWDKDLHLRSQNGLDVDCYC